MQLNSDTLVLHALNMYGGGWGGVRGEGHKISYILRLGATEVEGGMVTFVHGERDPEIMHSQIITWQGKLFQH